MNLGVSFIIPVYNGARFIGETLGHIFAQTVPAHQVIVVDDGSTDNLDQALAPWRNRIELIRIPNSGVNVARNTGAARATGSWLAFMDSDDIPLPKFVESQFRLIEASGNARSSIVDCKDVVNGVWAERSHFSYAPEDFWNVRRRDFGEAGYVIDESLAEKAPRYQPTIPSACMVSRALFLEMDGWDLRMNRVVGGQDTEFHFRQLDHPPIAVAPKVLLGYRKHASSWTADELRALAGDIVTWRRIAEEFELGRKKAPAIEEALQHMTIDLLTTAFNRRRFDICREWKIRDKTTRLPASLRARMALTGLPDALLGPITAVASSLRGTSSQKG